MEEPKSIAEQRNRQGYLKDLFTTCYRCHAKYSCGMEIMDPCGGGDDYNIEFPWSFYHGLQPNLCFKCVSKMTPTEIKTMKEQEDRKKAEREAEIIKKNTTYDPCSFAKKRALNDMCATL